MIQYFQTLSSANEATYAYLANILEYTTKAFEEFQHVISPLLTVADGASQLLGMFK